jgi:hypothetical protein
VTSGTQALTVTPGPPTALTVTPQSVRVLARASQEFAASGVDALGNVFPVAARWSLTPASIGTLAAREGATTSFTASRTLGRGTVTAVLVTDTGSLSATAEIQVVAGRLRIAKVTYRTRKRTVFVTVSAVDTAGRPISGAGISALVRRDGRRYVFARAETGSAGRTVYRVPAPRVGGCLTTTIRRASAAGFVWDKRTPRNRHCLPRST